MQDHTTEKQKTIVVKKYANRRLYNTETSSYVTLDDLTKLVKKGQEFQVYDAKSNEDITHSILTQIILGEEGKGNSLLPISFLRQLIPFYDDNLCSLVSAFLDMSMNQFSGNQDNMRKYMKYTLGNLNPMMGMESIINQNLTLFPEVMKRFAPAPILEESPDKNPHSKADEGGDEIKVLKNQVAQLYKKIEELTQK